MYGYLPFGGEGVPPIINDLLLECAGYCCEFSVVPLFSIFRPVNLLLLFLLVVIFLFSLLLLLSLSNITFLMVSSSWLVLLLFLLLLWTRRVCDSDAILAAGDDRILEPGVASAATTMPVVRCDPPVPDKYANITVSRKTKTKLDH